jgi:hypothetical protein
MEENDEQTLLVRSYTSQMTNTVCTRLTDTTYRNNAILFNGEPSRISQQRVCLPTQHILTQTQWASNG